MYLKIHIFFYSIYIYIILETDIISKRNKILFLDILTYLPLFCVTFSEKEPMKMLNRYNFLYVH